LTNQEQWDLIFYTFQLQDSHDLSPDNEKVCLVRDLAQALAKVELSEQESTAWHRDLQTTRQTLIKTQRLDQH
jgi:hypothetical protein